MEQDTMQAKEIGKRIRAAREALRLKQHEVGSRMVPPKTGAAIERWESGKRKGFTTAELDQLADILFVTRVFLETGEGQEVSLRESDSVIALIDVPWKVPLVAFSNISRARLNAAMSEAMAKRRFHATAYAVPNGGLAFRMMDNSMAPIDKGCTVTIGFGIEPDPGDCVVAEFGSVTVFRRFAYGEDGKILLSPASQGWKKYEFTEEEWRQVDIIGVMTAYETPARNL